MPYLSMVFCFKFLWHIHASDVFFHLDVQRSMCNLICISQLFIEIKTYYKSIPAPLPPLANSLISINYVGKLIFLDIIMR